MTGSVKGEEGKEGELGQSEKRREGDEEENGWTDGGWKDGKTDRQRDGDA